MPARIWGALMGGVGRGISQAQALNQQEAEKRRELELQVLAKIDPESLSDEGREELFRRQIELTGVKSGRPGKKGIAANILGILGGRRPDAGENPMLRPRPRPTQTAQVHPAPAAEVDLGIPSEGGEILPPSVVPPSTQPTRRAQAVPQAPSEAGRRPSIFLSHAEQEMRAIERAKKIADAQEGIRSATKRQEMTDKLKQIRESELSPEEKRIAIAHVLGGANVGAYAAAQLRPPPAQRAQFPPSGTLTPGSAILGADPQAKDAYGGPVKSDQSYMTQIIAGKPGAPIPVIAKPPVAGRPRTFTNMRTGDVFEMGGGEDNALKKVGNIGAQPPVSLLTEKTEKPGTSDEDAESLALGLVDGTIHRSKVPMAMMPRVKRIIDRNGWVVLEPKQREAMADYQNATKIIDDMYGSVEHLFTEEGPQARLGGLVQRGKAAIGMLPELRVVDTFRQALAPMFRKAIGRDTGNVAQQEATSAAKMAPEAGMTRQEFERQRTFLTALVTRAQANTIAYAKQVFHEVPKGGGAPKAPSEIVPSVSKNPYRKK